ncbi:MAG TPA: MFS transporter [Methylomirabilota bacterium]|nr:MFS transporter [Methylomirabilota bacterium]
MIGRIGRILSDVVPLRRGEWKLALFLYGILTLMVAADWVGKLGADALFVKRYGVNEIPKMYIVTPLVMLAVSALIFYFVDRIRRRTMLIWYVAAVTLSSLAIQWFISTSSGAAGEIIQPISYIFAHGVKETIYILFWVYAGNLYDVEQSKRLFPFFAGSVLVGKIIGGAAGAAIAPAVHAENFIGAQAVGFAVCLLAIILYRNLPEGHGQEAKQAHRPSGLRESLRDSVDGYRTVASDKLLVPFGVGVFFWYFLMQFANFLYLVGLDQSTGTKVGGEDAFSVLYASVYTSSSLVALGIQSFLTTPLVRRFGVARVLFLLPLWYLASYGAAAWAYGQSLKDLVFPTAVALQLGERIVIPSVHRPATELVYTQVSAAIRPRARAFLSGGVNAIGNMAAAVGLIAGLALFQTGALLTAGAVFSGIFALNTWQTRGAFGRRIAENLASSDEAMRRNAMDMLHSEGSAVPTDLLRNVADEGSDEVAHGARLALTRRGVLAVAADSAE